MDNKLYNTEHEARMNIVNRYLHREHAGKIDLTFSLFSGEAWSHFCEYVSSQNNIASVNP
jgi:hypothetical protein